MNADKSVETGTPSDWPSNWSGLKELDTMLRCAICFEYMNTAMLLSNCSHNYCSLCIRRYICYKEQCPTCLKAVVDSDLRNNRIIDNIIDVFRTQRSHLLAAVRGTPITESHSKENLSDKMTSSNKTSEAPHSAEQKSSERLKLPIVLSEDEDSDATVDDSLTQNVNEGNPVDDVKSNSMSSGFISDSPIRSDNSPKIHPFRSPLSTVNSRLSSLPSASSPLSALGSHHPQTSDNVICPVCNVGIPARNINLHLDRCLNSDKNSVATAPNHTPKRKCLPKLVYNLLSDKELRRKIAEVGLPHGDRKTMIQRHREYTLIYNSECDSLNPKSGADIVRDIMNAESNKAHLSASSSTSSLQSMLRAEKATHADDADDARKKYAQQHKSQFQQLLEAARKSRAAKASKAADDSRQNSSVDSASELTTDETTSSELTSKSDDLTSTAKTNQFFALFSSDEQRESDHVHGDEKQFGDERSKALEKEQLSAVNTRHYVSDSDDSSDFDMTISNKSPDLLSTTSLTDNHQQPLDKTGEPLVVSESSSSLPATQENSFNRNAACDDEGRPSSPDLIGFLDGTDRTDDFLTSPSSLALSSDTANKQLPRVNSPQLRNKRRSVQKRTSNSEQVGDNIQAPVKKMCLRSKARSTAAAVDDDVSPLNVVDPLAETVDVTDNNNDGKSKSRRSRRR